MNQILRLLLLKYTHRKKMHILKKKQKNDNKRITVPSSLPVTVVARTFAPEVVAILDFLHFYVSAT